MQSFSVYVPVAGNNQTNTEPSSPHPAENDSGTVALIAIAVLTAILIISSAVSIIKSTISCAIFGY